MDNRLKKLRLEKNNSQQKKSNEIGVNMKANSLFEKGEREPRLETWIKLAKYFDVPKEYLQGSMSYSEYKKLKESRDKTFYYVDKIEKIMSKMLKEPNKSEKYTKEIYREFDSIKKELENMQNFRQ